MNTFFVKFEFADGTVGRMQAYVDTEAELPALIARGVYESPVIRWKLCAAEDFPADPTFRDAWRWVGDAIVTDITAAKAIAHVNRRIARASELAPLDIQSTVPHLAASAEAARQLIRNKYAAMQIAIDSAQTVEHIKAAACLT